MLHKKTTGGPQPSPTSSHNSSSSLSLHSNTKEPINRPDLSIDIGKETIEDTLLSKIMAEDPLPDNTILMYRDPLENVDVNNDDIQQGENASKKDYLIESASDLSDTHSEESKEDTDVPKIVGAVNVNDNFNSGSQCRKLLISEKTSPVRGRGSTYTKENGNADGYQFKKLSYNDVERSIDRYYNTLNHRYSSALDILASYLKGHKIIYMEAKTYTANRLHMLMLPAIGLSAIATVLAGMSQEFDYGTIVLSVLNAFIGFLLGIVNFLKLDAATEAHTMSCHQYDKLQTSIEFASGAVLLFRDFDMDGVGVAEEIKHRKELNTEMTQKMANVDRKIMEIKEMNRFLN